MAFFLQPHPAAFAGGGQNGSGAGGVEREGRTMTFHSAGFKVKETAEVIEEVPSLMETMNFFSKTPDLTLTEQSDFMSALVPAVDRKYYRVQEDFFTKEIHDRLIAEYRRVVDASIDETKVFAVTDKSTRTTYLLPRFYKLETQSERMAILYHEAYWLKFPDATYKQTMDSEMLFQAYLENPSSLEARIAWLKSIDSRVGLLRSIIQVDLRDGNLAGLLEEDSGLPVIKLFGEQYYNCANVQGPNCIPFLTMNLMILKKAYPRSLFLSYFAYKVDHAFDRPEINDLRMGFYARRYGGGGGGSIGGMPFQMYGMEVLFLKGLIDLKNVIEDKENRNVPALEVKFPKRMWLDRFQKEQQLKIQFGRV